MSNGSRVIGAGRLAEEMGLSGESDEEIVEATGHPIGPETGVARRPCRGTAATICAIPAGDFVLMSGLIPEQRGATSDDHRHSQRECNFPRAAFTTRAGETTCLPVVIA